MSDEKISPFRRQLLILEEMAKEYIKGKTVKSSGFFVTI